MPATKPHLIFIRLWLTGARCSCLQGAYHRNSHLFLFFALFNEMCACMLTYILVCVCVCIYIWVKTANKPQQNLHYLSRTGMSLLACLTVPKTGCVLLRWQSVRVRRSMISSHKDKWETSDQGVRPLKTCSSLDAQPGPETRRFMKLKWEVK